MLAIGMVIGAVIAMLTFWFADEVIPAVDEGE